jgi:hypothetical protein
MADRNLDECPGILGDILHFHSDRISQLTVGWADHGKRIKHI